MVYTGQDASIFPAKPLPLGREPSSVVKIACSWGLEQGTEYPLVTYALQSRLAHISVSFKERSDVLRLTTPDIAMNGPVESEFKTAPVE